ncbi:IucA/IucC family C-terminal-domain containing protein [Streptomyces sp. JJ66]|uniref:IucA/IucC family C-terminal-domain containing protein n=1 Tax=Streptomyces sp. JJ66 TaxID=2803843 RepID=UPI0027E350F3|nr:IucA/IucC family C-terminal-domain containing protein [Streptomyces sp. JJ66]
MEGFFALRSGPPPDGSARPLAELYAGAAGPLRSRLALVGARLGAPEPRVAASIAYLGLAARLWSITLAPCVRGEPPPDLSPALLRWDPSHSTPDDLWLTPAAPVPPPADPVTHLRATVLDAHLVPLLAATRAEVRVSARLLWGNAASALAGALIQLGRPARAETWVADLLAAPPLAGTGQLGPGGFRRSTCCLYYRAPGGSVCGDCCFTTPPRR